MAHANTSVENPETLDLNYRDPRGCDCACHWLEPRKAAGLFHKEGLSPRMYAACLEISAIFRKGAGGINA